MKPQSFRLPALRNLQVTERSIADLRPHPKNARTHSDRQLHQIAKSIENFGFTVPVLIDDQASSWPATDALRPLARWVFRRCQPF
jgi:hypothetical protein